MNFTDEMIARAKTAASAAELQAMAKEYNIELSESDAAEYFDFLNGKRKVNEDGLQELSTVELQMVAGGKGEPKTPDPKYQVGQTLWLGFPSTKTFVKITILEIEFYLKSDGWRYLAITHYGYQESYYLDDRNYILTTDPQGVWPYK